MKPLPVYWKGSTPPSSRELRAIRAGLRSGAIKPGDELSPGRARRNPAPARARAAQDAYTDFHWGDDPESVRTVKLPSYDRGVYELGELRAVEYETHKDGQRARWVHDFKRPYPKITATPSGKLGPIVGGRAFVTDRGIED